MDTIIFFGIIAVLCAMLQSIGIWRNGLFFGFAITTTLLAIHYDFGSDYWSYYDWFEKSLYSPRPKSISEFLEMSRDPGWDILNLLFGRLFGENGFYIMVAVLSVVEGLCYYIFIKKLVPTTWYWFAMALYVFNNQFFILTFSMMRQSLVMAVLLLCFMWMRNKKIFLPFMTILLLSTIHNSVILCLPLIFLPVFPFKNTKIWAIVLLILLFVFLTSSAILEPILARFAALTDSFTRYIETYTDDSEIKFGLGYLLRLLPFFYLLYGLYTDQFSKDDIPILIVWSLSIILIPFGTIIPMFGRLLFYFELAGLVAFPKIINTSPLMFMRFIITTSILLLCVYSLHSNFYNPTSVYYQSYLNFATIFHL